MSEVIFHASGFAILIALGWMLRELGVVGRDAQLVLPNIMLRVTLPAAIIANLNGGTISLSELYFVVMGIVVNAFALLCAWIYGHSRNEAGFAMVNLAGCNIGCFAMPFISGLLGGREMVMASLFDIGNSMMCLGINYAIAAQVEVGGPFNGRRAVRSVLTSVPVVTYIAMLLLCMFQVSLPEAIMPPIETAARANPFIAMMVIGVSIGFAKGDGAIARIIRYCVMRFAISLALVAAISILPIPGVARCVASVLCFAPIGAVSSVYTRKLGEDAELSACINSAYVPISIVCMSMVMLLFG